jgi:uncharacterized protein YkwD
MAPKKQILVIIAAVLAAVGIGADVTFASAQTTAAVSAPAAQAPGASPVITSALTVSSAQTAAAAAVVAAINHSRAIRGIPVLWWGVRVTASAHAHNLAMAAANTLSHQVPGEASLGTRISRQGVSWTWVGENVGEASSLSTAGALFLEQLMMTEVYPGHRDNILSRYPSVVGVDVVFDTVHHKLWLTEDFAN